MSVEMKFGPLTGPLMLPAMPHDESEAHQEPGDEAVRPERALVLLHGWGADGRDLADLADPLQQMMPDLAVFCPHAPAACSANPMGRQWFELTERFYRNPEEVLPEMQEMAYLVEAAVDELCHNYQIPLQNVVVGGFSQGGMMSLHIAMQARLEAAGFASLSGALIDQANLDDAYGHHIFLAHGTDDTVVPFAASSEARSFLEDAGHHVELLSRQGLGHGIDMTILEALGHFIYHVTSD